MATILEALTILPKELLPGLQFYRLRVIPFGRTQDFHSLRHFELLLFIPRLTRLLRYEQ